MISIRPASESDFQQWAVMRNALWPSLSVEGHRVEISEKFNLSTEKKFVAEDQQTGKLLGFMELAIRPYVDGCDTNNVTFLEGIFVAGSHRHQGIGRQFVVQAEQWAREQGSKEFASNAELANTLSHTAHIAWGFEETERVVYFKKELL